MKYCKFQLDNESILDSAHIEKSMYVLMRQWLICVVDSNTMVMCRFNKLHLRELLGIMVQSWLKVLASTYFSFATGFISSSHNRCMGLVTYILLLYSSKLYFALKSPLPVNRLCCRICTSIWFFCFCFF